MSDSTSHPDAEWRAYLATVIAGGALDDAVQLVIRRLREHLTQATGAVNLLAVTHPDLDATAKGLLTMAQTAHIEMAEFITTQVAEVLLPRIREQLMSRPDSERPDG